MSMLHPEELPPVLTPADVEDEWQELLTIPKHDPDYFDERLRLLQRDVLTQIAYCAKDAETMRALARAAIGADDETR